ncbi:hypothetical protein TNIN_426551 [Trichonephila inaurata madagascariensis]|uniref:Uncharacterized protein n=1 Tax=Trichonephila inaurata madagascariensis TaxID=2747483 RepID=A0A8X6XDP9_9ARAC|nr:hypothetical protein TNIN_426551 [Trichonephila inaurata madagascariensis]
MNRDDSDLSSLSEEDDYQGDNGSEMDDDDEDQDVMHWIGEVKKSLSRRDDQGSLRETRPTNRRPSFPAEFGNKTSRVEM